MLYKNNVLVKTFSSVGFALFLLCAIAFSSIAGTIIPQGESLQFYAERYGMKPTMIMELLQITDMYTSYWFQGLLVLLCISLIICTWVRLPGVFAIIRKDNLNRSAESLKNDADTVTLISDAMSSSEQGATLKSVLSSSLYRSKTLTDSECLYLYDKGARSRLGAYIVHISILMIVCGALVGKYFGYDAFVMVTEGTSISTVHESGDGHADIELGFEVFCRNFITEYYPNGAPKEYRSDLTVLKSGKTIFNKSITVNDPLKYEGVTFFQSSYQPIDNEYKLFVGKKSLTNPEDVLKKAFFLNAEKEEASTELNFSFKILATSSDGHGHGPYKIQFTGEGEAPVTREVDDHEAISIESNDAVYTFSLTQRHATGLKVVMDPGVWIVYLGCGLMMLGLYISFFMSHIRIWILYKQDGDGMKVWIAGKTNKNSVKFEQLKEKIINRLLAEKNLALRRQ